MNSRRVEHLRDVQDSTDARPDAMNDPKSGDLRKSLTGRTILAVSSRVRSLSSSKNRELTRF